MSRPLGSAEATARVERHLAAGVGDQVVDERAPAQAGLAEGGRVLGAVEDDAERLVAAVLGHVELQRHQAGLVGARGREDVDELGRVRLRALQRAHVHGREAELGRHRERAGAAARLHAQDAARQRVAVGGLLGVGGRVGGDQAARGVEHRDVPVTLGAVQPDADGAAVRHADVARGHARLARPVGRVAGPGERPRGDAQRLGEHRPRREEGRLSGWIRRRCRRRQGGDQQREDGEQTADQAWHEGIP